MIPTAWVKSVWHASCVYTCAFMQIVSALSSCGQEADQSLIEAHTHAQSGVDYLALVAHLGEWSLRGW